MHFHFFFFDLIVHTFFMKCVLFFIFLIFLNLIKFLLLMNLHFFSFFSTWMIFHGISCFSCVFWWISILSQLNENSCTTWWKFLHSLLSFSILFFGWSLSGLMAYSFSHSLIPPQNLISPWWISFLPNFDELSFLNLMNSSSTSLSLLRTLPSGVG